MSKNKKRSRTKSISSESDSSYSESDLEIQEILGTLKDLNLDKPLKKKDRSEVPENLSSSTYSNVMRPIDDNNEANKSMNESIQNLNYLVDTLSTDIGIKIKTNNESTISFILSECLTIFDHNYQDIDDPILKQKLFTDIANILRRINYKLNNTPNHNTIRNRIEQIQNHMLKQLQRGGRRKRNKKTNKKKTNKRKRKNKRATRKKK